MQGIFATHVANRSATKMKNITESRVCMRYTTSLPPQSWCLALGSSDAVPGSHPLPRDKTHTAAGVTQKGECGIREWGNVTRGEYRNSQMSGLSPIVQARMQPLLGCSQCRDPAGSMDWAGSATLASLHPDPWGRCLEPQQ